MSKMLMTVGLLALLATMTVAQIVQPTDPRRFSTWIALDAAEANLVLDAEVDWQHPPVVAGSKVFSSTNLSDTVTFESGVRNLRIWTSSAEKGCSIYVYSAMPYGSMGWKKGTTVAVALADSHIAFIPGPTRRIVLKAIPADTAGGYSVYYLGRFGKQVR